MQGQGWKGWGGPRRAGWRRAGQGSGCKVQGKKRISTSRVLVLPTDTGWRLCVLCQLPLLPLAGTALHLAGSAVRHLSACTPTDPRMPRTSGAGGAGGSRVGLPQRGTPRRPHKHPGSGGALPLAQLSLLACLLAAGHALLASLASVPATATWLGHSGRELTL